MVKLSIAASIGIHRFFRNIRGYIDDIRYLFDNGCRMVVEEPAYGSLIASAPIIDQRKTRTVFVS